MFGISYSFGEFQNRFEFPRLDHNNGRLFDLILFEHLPDVHLRLGFLLLRPILVVCYVFIEGELISCGFDYDLKS